MSDDGLEVLDKVPSAPQAPRNQSDSPSEPKGLTQQSQKAWQNYKSMPVHSFLTDCYTGKGVCLCTAQKNNRTAIVPNKSELQFEDRVENSERVNFVKKHIDTQVVPIFEDTNIENTLYKNGEEATQDHGLITWITKGYDNYLQQCCKWARLNGVIYVLMDKLKNGDITRNYRRGVDVLFEPQIDEETEELNWIMFFDRRVLDRSTVGTNSPQYVLKATIHYMEGGKYFKQRMTAPDNSEWKTRDEDWKPDGEPIDTGSTMFGVIPIVENGHPETEYLPDNPSTYEVARLDMLVMNMLSTMLWAHKMHGHPLAVIWGKLQGLNYNIGSIANMPLPTEGNVAPKPEYLERDPNSLQVSLDFLKWVIGQLRDTMKQYGVTAVESNTQQAQTAESKSYDYIASNAALRNTINTFCVPIDQAIVNHYMYLKTGSTDEWTLERTYPKDFYPDTGESIDELLDIEERAKTRGLVEVAEEVWKVIVEMIAPNTSLDRKKELAEELKSFKEMLTTDDIDDLEEDTNEGGEEE